MNSAGWRRSSGQRNRVDGEIAAIIDRPAHAGHIGEFVAAAIFDIGLHESASHRGADGHFMRGPLAGRTVNIKKYSTDQGVLDIQPDALPDLLLGAGGCEDECGVVSRHDPALVHRGGLPARGGPAHRATPCARRQDWCRYQRPASHLG